MFKVIAFLHSYNAKRMVLEDMHSLASALGAAIYNRVWRNKWIKLLESPRVFFQLTLLN